MIEAFISDVEGTLPVTGCNVNPFGSGPLLVPHQLGDCASTSMFRQQKGQQASAGTDLTGQLAA
jgi:hypothetical protein